MAEIALQQRVCVRRTIGAPASEVFDAWLDAGLLAKWMKTRAFTHATVACDAREGGGFEIVMQSPGGEIRHTGDYLTIDRPRKLVFTWRSPATGQRDSLVTVEFSGDANTTDIVVTHCQLPADTCGAHSEGWGDVLDLLARLFAH
ncbi:SRPBCC family protein [Pseudoduganella violaceinigra]|uniref:SRPBCC family protein n=1 Tax=Pseudoduganella violaceinigra TaxID=246602 RepID=UPI000427FBE2|nr:SRPBCC domain-containing protein [Pseudoduganella violaceinigra]